MKKRIFSALMALCLAFSISGAAFAAPEDGPAMDATAGAPQTAAYTADANGAGSAGDGTGSAEGSSSSESTGSESSSTDSTPSSSEESQEEAVSSSSSSSEGSSGSESSSASSGSEVTSDSASSDVSSDSTIPESGSSSSNQGESAPSGSEQDPVQGDPSAEQAGPANGMPESETDEDLSAEQANGGISTYAMADEFAVSWEHESCDDDASVTVQLYDAETTQPITANVENITLQAGQSWNVSSAPQTLTSDDGDTYTYASAEYGTYRRGSWTSNGDFTSVSASESSQDVLWETFWYWSYTYNSDKTYGVLASKPTIRLYYNKDDSQGGTDPDEPVAEGAFYIKDTVVSDGNFTVVQKGQDGDDALPEGYTVDWSRVVATDNEMDETKAPQTGWSNTITRKVVHHDMYNLSEDGKSVNVTLDAKLAGVQDNQRVWYRATVKDSEGNAVATLYKRVPYYIELQNGGFETPVRQNGQHNVDLTPDQWGNVDDKGVIWKTTDKNNQIEIIRPNGRNTSQGTYNSHGINEAPQGGQVAELNADSEGTLYQDVLTVPETTLNWSLMHRARNNAAGGFYSGYDTMYVVIMSTEDAEQITSQNDVREIIRAAGFEPTEYVEKEGKEERKVTISDRNSPYYGSTISVWRITDYIDGKSADPGKGSWNYYSDEYEVPEGQYMSRFFFAAGATGYDHKNPNSSLAYTVGNLLDGVQFTPDALDPYPGQATIKVTKTVNGLTAEQLKDYSVSFAVKEGETEIATITVSNFSAPDENGNSTANGSTLITLGTNVTTKKLTITENLPSGYDDYDVTTASASGGTDGKGTISVTVSDQQATEVTYTNTYEEKIPETVNLTLTKTFDGLSDAEVEYLINDAGFGWDVNFCIDNYRISYDKYGNPEAITYMADTDAVPDNLKLPGVKGDMGGGDFVIKASDYLEDWSTSETNYENDLSEYTAYSKFVKQDGTWKLTITIEVPTTDEHHFYTVFEQHQEVPGYAKINDSNAEYTITQDGKKIADGTGKFVDYDVVNGNVYEDMKTEVSPVKDQVCMDKNGEPYYDDLEGEEAAIHSNQLTRLSITSDTTIDFTNHYTGKLDVTKTIDENNQLDEANSKIYTLTIQPATLTKLDLDSKAEGTQHGLAGKMVTYKIVTIGQDGKETPVENGTGTKGLGSDGSFTIDIQPGQTIHFTDMPAIQWQVSEVTDSASIANYTLEVGYLDDNNGVVSEKTHWNGYKDDVETDIIGGTSNADGIASVDSAVRNNDEHKVVASAVAKVTVTNKYTRNTVTLTVNKTVTGTMGDTSQENKFNFTLTTSEPIDEKINELTGINVDGKYQYSFQLAADGQIEIVIPAGVEATVWEEDRPDYTEKVRGYATPKPDETVESLPSFTESNTTSVEAMDTNYTVDFQNNRDAVAPTGLESNHTAPYALMVTAAGVAGLALLGSMAARRRRRQE